jgi:hypothetical protein
MDSPVVDSKSEGGFFLEGTYYGARLGGTFHDYEDTIAVLRQLRQSLLPTY